MALELGDIEQQRHLLQDLELRIRMKLLTQLAGDYLGVLHGLGTELGETRPYEPGDDVRRIDWNVSALSLIHI